MAKVKNIKVLFASHMHELHGGGELALIEQIEYLHKTGYVLHVVVGGNGQIYNKLKTMGIDTTIIYMPWWVKSPTDHSEYAFRSGNPYLNSLNEMINLLRKFKPDLCVSNTMVNPWLAYAASITNYRHVWQIHEIGTAGQKLSYYLGEEQTIKNIDSLCDGVFFNSQITANSYLPAIPENKLLGIVPPVGLIDKPKIIKSPFKKSNSIKLVSVGALKEQKGQFVTVSAVNKLLSKGYNIELILVGGYEDKKYVKKIEKYIYENKLSAYVQLIGQVNNPNSYVHHADISIIAATNEAFGRVTVEAMQMGKIVLGANSGGTAEIINDGRNGILFEPSSPEDLTKKIEFVINNESLRSVISKEAKNNSKKKYNNKERYKDFIAYLDNLENQPKSAINLAPLEYLAIDYAEVCANARNIRLRFVALKSAKYFTKKVIPKSVLSKIRNLK